MNECDITWLYIHVERFKPLHAELYPISHLLALLGTHLIFHVSRIKVKVLSSSSSCSGRITFCFLFLVTSKWNWSLHLFLGRPMCLRPFGLYCSTCLGVLFLSNLCMCCSHLSWYSFISFTIFSVPVFSLKHWFVSLSSFVIPRRCLKNFLLCCFQTLFLSFLQYPSFTSEFQCCFSCNVVNS